ncbi:hypothetical protein TSOC_008494 [Tetrabaena socialis]|uniref:EF-hand domain-containing protein n=1 Tax=Tetrabaena socialis TaxID=47790 RepID=A0A2J7ZYA4_9CHLO|nr:hypothetical protein TSOC_008494 [Tetrabaena socialis]|eukprot:PNH05254.1 hypothetical protein TSOC_008494 [Tetrabaena socialis]
MAGLLCGRVCTAPVASSRGLEQPIPAPQPARSSRRSVLLGLGAGLAGLVSTAGSARAASTPLADLVMPLVLRMDANGDGRLNVDEIRGAMQRTSGDSAPREVVYRDVMAPVDFNRDGVVRKFLAALQWPALPHSDPSHVWPPGTSGLRAHLASGHIWPPGVKDATLGRAAATIQR